MKVSSTGVIRFTKLPGSKECYNQYDISSVVSPNVVARAGTMFLLCGVSAVEESRLRTNLQYLQLHISGRSSRRLQKNIIQCFKQTTSISEPDDDTKNEAVKEYYVIRFITLWMEQEGVNLTEPHRKFNAINFPPCATQCSLYFVYCNPKRSEYHCC